MCGISMILDFDGYAQAKHIHPMMNAIKHRGPDDKNYLYKPFGNGKLFLGGNRLKIIDRDDNANQPFVSKDGNYALIFNGEIYNFENLRNELVAEGVVFTTRSDTEFLLHWLISKGRDGIKNLNGMFAFIFVNFLSVKILIARDHLGIKPLFFHQSQNKFIFSSEIQGVLASELVEKKLNEVAIPHYLAYKYAPRPATFYKEIDEFMPSSIWEIDKKANLKKSAFRPKPELIKTPINELLIDAVVQQYSEPNNTGVMLSGGVDSTLLLAILNKELGYRNVPVYSVATRNKNKFDTKDGIYAKQAAKLYEAEYNEIGINQSSLNNIDEYIKTLGQPIADSGGYLTWLLAEKAVEKSNVLLSGAGADELFGGYNRHTAFYKYLTYKNKWWFSLLMQGGRLSNQLNKLAKSVNTDPSTTFNNFIQSDTFKKNGSLWDADFNNEDHFKKALIYDQQNYMGADVLAITDHATMQHSIEARVPYLDTQLVALARELSGQTLLKKEPKSILKEQLIMYGGIPFSERKKKGFGLPMNDWIKANSLWEFNAKNNFIHKFIPMQKIKDILQMHTSNKENLTQELWRILLLHKWLAHHF